MLCEGGIELDAEREHGSESLGVVEGVCAVDSMVIQLPPQRCVLYVPCVYGNRTSHHV